MVPPDGSVFAAPASFRVPPFTKVLPVYVLLTPENVNTPRPALTSETATVPDPADVFGESTIVLLSVRSVCAITVASAKPIVIAQTDLTLSSTIVDSPNTSAGSGTV